MQSVKMYNLKKLILLLCITSGLTFSINESKTDGASKNISSNLNNSNILNSKMQTKTDQVISTTVPSTSIKETKEQDVHLLQTEGGPISNAQSVQSIIPDQSVSTMSDSSKIIQNTSTEKSVSPTTTKHEDTSSKVLGRKRGHLMLDQTTINYEKENAEIHVTAKDDNDNVHSSKSKNDTKIADNSTQLNNTSGIPSVPNLSEKTLHVSSTSTTMPLSSKHKPNPKPTVTMGGGAADPNKPIPPSPTKSSPLGMPRKIDYIIPIAITVFALPILGVTTFILYNRGKDCWDKRHYRRMDFLIDGMYND